MGYFSCLRPARINEFYTMVSDVSEIEPLPEKFPPQPRKQRPVECKGPSFFNKNCCPSHEDYGCAKDRKIDVRLRVDGVWHNELLRVSANVCGKDFFGLAGKHLSEGKHASDTRIVFAYRLRGPSEEQGLALTDDQRLSLSTLRFLCSRNKVSWLTLCTSHCSETVRPLI